MSFTRLSVIPPKLHFAARPFSSFQNCLSVSPSFCFLLRNLKLSRVSFFWFLKAFFTSCYQLCQRYSCNVYGGNFVADSFLAAIPRARYMTLNGNAFFAAVVSSMSPIRLFSFVPVVLVNSVIEMLYFAINATSNKSIHFSYSNLRGFAASDQ